MLAMWYKRKVTYKTVHSAFPSSQIHTLWAPLALFARHLWAKSNLKSHIGTPCRSQYYWDLSLHYMRASLVAQTVKSLPAVQKTRVQSLGQEEPLEKEMATHSSTLAWKISWTEDPGRLQSMVLQRVRHDWATSLHTMDGPWNHYAKWNKPDTEVSILYDSIYVRSLAEANSWSPKAELGCPRLMEGEGRKGSCCLMSTEFMLRTKKS